MSTPPKIVAHTLVKNEQNWLWYSLTSVLDFVDELLVWDTGSTDATLQIIKSISSPKLHFQPVGPIDSQSFTTARQRMLDYTAADWLFILDGDEIWPSASISATRNLINNFPSCEYLIHPHYDLVGDVYHYQDPAAGRYHIGPYSGHVNIRFINLHRIPGLHFDLPHGQQGLFDDQHFLIQDRIPFRGQFINLPYLHATHLSRSVADHQVIKRSFKYKYDLGIPFPSHFSFPRSFYLPAPPIVPSPWVHRSWTYVATSFVRAPFQFIGRHWLPSPTSGY